MPETTQKRRQALRIRLTLDQRNACAICGGQMRAARTCLPDSATLDHITPQSLGGTDEISNLRVAHRRCNLDRGVSPATWADMPARKLPAAFRRLVASLTSTPPTEGTERP